MMKNISALIYSTTATIWFVVVLTIGAELSKPFKDLLAGVTGHPWTTKGVFSLVFFVLAYFALSKLKEPNDILKAVFVVCGSVIFGGFLIFGFYLWHFFA